MNEQFIIVLTALILTLSYTLLLNNNVYSYFQISDNSPPSITVVDPISGSSIPDNIIVINGTSHDNESGIRQVEVLSHPYPFNDRYEFEIANAVSYDNWSEWSIPISVGAPGVYRILAHAEDRAGNENWYESIINVPFPGTVLSQKYNIHIAFVNPTFTDAAYHPNAFYDFYAKYQTVPWGKNITADRYMLKTPLSNASRIDPYTSSQTANDLAKFSKIDPDNTHIVILNDIIEGKIPSTFSTVINDEDVHNGYIFDHEGNNAYDILILSHDEYVTTPMYENYKRFVSDGGIIVFLDGNIFYAEVDYEKDHTITLVKGHNWEFDGDVARKSVGERWFYENQKWVGSNFLASDIYDDISFKHNPFNYTHFEENYVSNPMARILIDYKVDLPESMSHLKNATVATYELDFGRGKVIMIGLYGQKLVYSDAFLNLFETLLLNSIHRLNTDQTTFEKN